MTRKIGLKQPFAQRGFSLLELLVGMIVGMMVIYGTVKIYAASDGRNRSVGSKNDTQMTLTVAAHALEQDIRLAGRGFTHHASDRALGCKMDVYNSNATSNTATFKLLPVYIESGGTAGPDTIHVFYGNSPVRVVPDMVDESTATTKKVANKGGFLLGDKILLTKAGDIDNCSDSTCLCAVAEVTERDDDPDVEGSILSHASDGAYISEYLGGKGATATMNPSNGTGVDDFSGSHIFSLGPAPSLNKWSIQKTSLLDAALLRQNQMPHNATEREPQEVALDIIDLKALYGYYNSYVDGTCGMISWMDPDDLNNNPDTNWKNVVAIRFALLARDPHFRQKPYKAENPVWYGGEFNMPKSDVEWQRYSYQVYESVVSLRNNLKQWREEDKNASQKC